MTPKERIITALKNGQPDAVPVTLGLSEMVPVKESGLTYIEYFWHEKRDLINDRCDTERRYGADVFLHSVEEPSIYDPDISVKALRESKDEVVFAEIIHTRAGDLESIKKITRTESIAIVKGFVDDPVEDCSKVLELLKNPETKSFEKYISDWNYVGNAGHCGLWLPTPADWWAILRRSPETAIYDFLDYPDTINVIFSEYTEYTIAMLQTLLANHVDYVDSIGLGGSSTSMSVMSPALLQQYTLPFVQKVKFLASNFGIPVQYHMCGRSRQAIPLLVDTGVDGMDALECPPTGNVDLGEVKHIFGDRISLRGNVNSITTILQGTPRDVEKEVIRCMSDAKAGGGFILGVGDQVPYWTPNENLHVFVETGRTWGKYKAA